MKDIRIVNPGFYTTVQDKGRWGYQEFGVPVAGAMDDYSFRLANILVGNNEYEATLETTLIGPEIAFNIDTVIAITGANMIPKINGYGVPMWRSLKLSQGDLLTFEMAKEGARGYIAFAGGLDIPAVMNSCSTYTRGGIGGYEGRKLKNGDEISLKVRSAEIPQLVNRIVPLQYVPMFKNNKCIRVVMGPQEDCFTEESIKQFLSSAYEVTSEADRMGYRLSGPSLEHIAGADIISDGITLGAIQVPGHGMPIIMMADRQTTGGYTKIATVISSDMHLLAQLKPGDKVRFARIDIEEAHRILKEYEDVIQAVKNDVNSYQLKSLFTKRYHISLEGISYDVLLEEIK